MSIDTPLVYEPFQTHYRRPPRSLQATRLLLERLVTVGTLDDLADLGPDELRPEIIDQGARDWYEQFGDSTPYWQGRDELLWMAFELCRRSKAPAARALNAQGWFDNWVELPHPALGFSSPAALCCTSAGLDAAKVVLRSLQALASE